MEIVQELEKGNSPRVNITTSKNNIKKKNERKKI